MKRGDVVIGGIYEVRVGRDLVPVRVAHEESTFGGARGWRGTSLVTGRGIWIRSAARLRRAMTQEEADQRVERGGEP